MADDSLRKQLPHMPTEEQFLNCIRCGLCLSACPIYRETLRETDGPRARVFITRKLVDGDLDFTPGVVDNMYKCLDCEACNAICPVGIKPADLAMEMRQVMHKATPQPWLKKPIFHGYFPHPLIQELSVLPLVIYQRLGLQALARRLGILRLLPKRLQDMEQMVPNLPARALRQVLPEVTPAYGEEKHTVAFFLGCFQSVIFARESEAAVKVMARNGCRVITPKDVKCCGMPAAGYGDIDLVKELARFNIDLFLPLDADVIVTDCATCGSTLKHYGEILEDDPDYAEKAAAFSSKVRDICEFLGSIAIRPPRGEVRARVTYHDPCHLVRAQNVRKEPRELLKMIPGVEFTEMKEADWCCGSAGTQILTHYHNSLTVNKRKMENVRASGADIVATGCPGCQMQLRMGANHYSVDVRVTHPMMLLEEAYEREDLEAQGQPEPALAGEAQR